MAARIDAYTSLTAAFPREVSDGWRGGTRLPHDSALAGLAGGII